WSTSGNENACFICMSGVSPLVVKIRAFSPGLALGHGLTGLVGSFHGLGRLSPCPKRSNESLYVPQTTGAPFGALKNTFGLFGSFGTPRALAAGQFNAMKDSHEKLSKKGRASCGVAGFPLITTCRGMLPLTAGERSACAPLGNGGSRCAGGAPAVVFAFKLFAGSFFWQL